MRTFHSRRVIISLICVALCAGSMGFMCTSHDGAPDADTCGAGATGGVDEIEIGFAGDSNFVPVRDGDAIIVDRGGQGSDMMGFRLRMRGSSVPTCLANRIQVTDFTSMDYVQDTTGVVTQPVRTYAEDDGSRTTATRWLVLTSSPLRDSMFKVTASVGDISVERSLVVVGR